MLKLVLKNIKQYLKVIHTVFNKKSLLIVDSNSPSVPSEPDIWRVLMKMERNRSLSSFHFFPFFGRPDHLSSPPTE